MTQPNGLDTHTHTHTPSAVRTYISIFSLVYNRNGNSLRNSLQCHALLSLRGVSYIVEYYVLLQDSNTHISKHFPFVCSKTGSLVGHGIHCLWLCTTKSASMCSQCRISIIWYVIRGSPSCCYGNVLVTKVQVYALLKHGFGMLSGAPDHVAMAMC